MRGKSLSSYLRSTTPEEKIMRQFVLASTFAVASGFAILTAPGAHAAIFFNGTGACLDVKNENTANYTPAFTCNATFAQQWNFESLAIQGVGTSGAGGKCVDVSNSGTAAGTLVQLYQCNGSAAQQWQYYRGQLINLNSGLCLDVGKGANFTQATIQSCNNSVGQSWAIRS
jgi:hypothetical protein